MRPLRGPDRARGLPALVVLPVGQEGLVKRGGIAVLGVLNAKEMAGIAHRFDRIQRDLIRAGGADLGLHVALDLLQHLAIHDELFGAGDQPALQPSGGVIHHVGARLHRGPKRIGGFPHRLPVRHIGGTDAGGPQRQAIEAGKLPGHLGRAHVFRRAKGGRARFHVHVGCECADRDRAAGADDLRQHHGAKRLCQRLRHGAGHGDRGHGARQGEGGHHQPLPAPRQPHPAVHHRKIVFQGRGRIDVGVHMRGGVEFIMGQTTRDAHHFHHILDPLAAQRIGVHDLVGQRQLVIKHVKVPHRGMYIHRFDGIAARKVDAVEILRQLQQVAAHLAGAGDLLANRHIPVVGR